MIEIVFFSTNAQVAGVFFYDFEYEDHDDPSFCLYPNLHLNLQTSFIDLAFLMPAIMEALWCTPEDFGFTNNREEMRLRLNPVSYQAIMETMKGFKKLGFKADAASSKYAKAYVSENVEDLKDEL